MLEGLNVLGEVVKDTVSGLLGEVLQVGADSFGRVLGVEGAQEACHLCVPLIFVTFEHFQAVHPGQSLCSEDAGELSAFSFIIPSGNFVGSFNLLDEPEASGGALTVVGIEQGVLGHPGNHCLVGSPFFSFGFTFSVVCFWVAILRVFLLYAFSLTSTGSLSRASCFCFRNGLASR